MPCAQVDCRADASTTLQAARMGSANPINTAAHDAVFLRPLGAINNKGNSQMSKAIYSTLTEEDWIAGQPYRLKRFSEKIAGLLAEAIKEDRTGIDGLRAINIAPGMSFIGKAPPAVGSPEGMNATGVELRDYFAAMAMQVVLYGHRQNPNEGIGGIVAGLSYKFADAMLEARK